MIPSFFNPFKEMIFDGHFCFLTGDLTTENMTVFPEWLMEHFKLGDEKISLMENSQVKMVPYKELELPCSATVKKAFEQIDLEFRTAFEKGYEGVSKLDEKLVFQWSGRIVYGLLYLEMLGEWEHSQKLGKEFDMAPQLKNHLGMFHLMMQSVVEPISFGERKPWSIVVFPLKYSADILSFRDDVINLLFQFGVNGFGFIVCFQDNGIIAEEQADILEKIKGHVLHPVQFEELFARLHYTADLLQYKPKYKFNENENGLKIEALPIEQTNPQLPLFGFWVDDFYARLLSNYWQVYGIEKGEIIQFQKPFLSFLEEPYSKDFIDPDTIKLPF
ncbi:MAG TPA: hypothetical protein VFM82_04705 [Flavobacteriaceae bacterium]|nr:hypothetical protein [Flavobacteriaceae bacterium]